MGCSYVRRSLAGVSGKGFSPRGWLGTGTVGSGHFTSLMRIPEVFEKYSQAHDVIDSWGCPVQTQELHSVILVVPL